MTGGFWLGLYKVCTHLTDITELCTKNMCVHCMQVTAPQIWLLGKRSKQLQEKSECCWTSSEGRCFWESTVIFSVLRIFWSQPGPARSPDFLPSPQDFSPLDRLWGCISDDFLWLWSPILTCVCFFHITKQFSHQPGVLVPLSPWLECKCDDWSNS